MLLSLLLGLLLSTDCGTPAADPPGNDFVRAMNLGKALLENKDSKGAIDQLTQAVSLDPDSTAARRNLARALLLARDSEGALASLGRAAELDDENASTSYLKGISLARLGRFEEALPHFERAVQLDPKTAALRYQLASAYQSTARHQQAGEQLVATLELDPLHGSAHFLLASYARGNGDRQAQALHQGEVRRLRQLLGEQNRSAEALESCFHTLPEGVAEHSDEAGEWRPRLIPASDIWLTDDSASELATRARAATVFEVDKDGRAIVFVATDDGRAFLLTAASSGPVVHALALPLPDLGNQVQALGGNFHDVVTAGKPYDPRLHAHGDLLLLGAERSVLLAGGGDGEFEDLTQSAGLVGVGGRRARWLDIEHDGDIDLAIAGPAGLAIWQNNGDRTFRQVSAEIGLEDPNPASDLAAVDFDDDVAIDLVVAHATTPSQVFDNQRTGSYARRSAPAGPWPSARLVALDDVDGDSHADAVLVSEQHLVIVPGRGGDRQQLDFTDFAATALRLTDLDNDGTLEILLAGHTGSGHESATTGRLKLWRRVHGSWQSLGPVAGLDTLELPPIQHLLSADLDLDGDSDLLLVTDDGLRLLRNEGGNAAAQLKLRLVGGKSNPDGLGVGLELRRGRQRINRTVAELPIVIGLGTTTDGATPTLDSLQVTWSNGVVDNQLDIAAGAVTVVEKNVATGSCPFLYAWDGEGYRFVTDLLGNSPVGLQIRRGVPLDADRDEYVEIGPASNWPARDGELLLMVTEEMREVLYLDQVRVVAVDHPPGVEVHPNDKLRPAPFPPSELVPLGDLRTARRVDSSDGLDRRAALSAIDGTFAPPGIALPPPLRGVTQPLSLTLAFGPLETSKPLILALTGWLQYGDASTNIALSQAASSAALPPRLEVETAAGDWQQVAVVVGVPAGKTKTILVDLSGQLPRGARRLRLSSSLEIRWDRIALGQRLPLSILTRTVIDPVRADFAWRGFSAMASRAPEHPSTPAFAELLNQPPWRHSPSGWATAYGDVLDLLTRAEHGLVIVAGGDAIELAFPTSTLPPRFQGGQRTYFFYSIGWDKDGDHNVIDGDRVGPLPIELAASDPTWQRATRRTGGVAEPEASRGGR